MWVAPPRATIGPMLRIGPSHPSSLTVVQPRPVVDHINPRFPSPRLRRWWLGGRHPVTGTVPGTRSADERHINVGILRKAGVSVAVAGVAAATLGLTAPDAHAAIDSYYTLAGNFAGDAREDAREEVSIYSPGPAQDFLVRFGDNGQGLITAATTFNVNGSYDPVVGDFDVDPYDEIFWYGPGGTADQIWSFTRFTTVTSKVQTVNGVFDPVAGDFNGDGYDDVFWYGPGAAKDQIWFFTSKGPAGRVTTVNGVYKPVVGSFGKDATDDIYWYAPGGSPDPLWDFTRGSGVPTSKALPAGGNYSPFSGDFYGDGWRGDDILFFDPTAGPEKEWHFFRGVPYNVPPVENVEGPYAPATGDYLVDGFEDVFWLRDDGTWILWDSNGCDNSGCYWDLWENAPASVASEAGESTAVEVGSVTVAEG